MYGVDLMSDIELYLISKIAVISSLPAGLVNFSHELKTVF